MDSEGSPAAPAAASSRWRLRFHPFEICAVLAFVAAVGFLRSFGLRIDWRMIGVTVYPMFWGLPLYLLQGVALYSLFRFFFGAADRGAPGVTFAARRAAVVSYWRRIREPSWLVLWLRLWLAGMLFTNAYFWLKVYIPLINPRLWDAEIQRLDVFLHLGISPADLVIGLCEGTFLVPLLDLWYGWWIPTVILTLAFFAAFPGDPLRRSFMLSCVLLWTAGAWMYLSLPVQGPIYAFPAAWAELRGALPLAEAGQRLLWENYQIVLASRTAPLGELDPTLGIAAMPSLHVGGHALFVFWARRRVPVLLVPFLAAAVLTFVGSLLTGWHYAVDGYVGVLLAWICYRVAVWWDKPGSGQLSQQLDHAGAPSESPEGATANLLRHRGHARSDAAVAPPGLGG